MVARACDDSAHACPFCSIARGEKLAAEPVCEGSEWVAFFPLEPATPGHTLVIPRAHAPNLWVLEPDIASALMQAVLRVGRTIEVALDPEGMNLITSSGTIAGQSVFHVHLHVVPRWGNDGFGHIWPPERPMAPQIREDAADRIRRACAGR